MYGCMDVCHNDEKRGEGKRRTENKKEKETPT